MKKILFSIAFAVLCFSVNALAQARPAEKSQETKTMARTAASAPASFEAKYEGGMFGFGQRQKGTLKFDDANERLVFYGKDRKEKFSIPYKAMLVISPQSQSVRSTAGSVVSAIPLPGAGLAGLIRSKRRYLVVNFKEPDADVRGLVNFRIENKELLESVLQTLGEKAKMTKRGDAYYRPQSIVKTEI